jgi:membrane protease YdiL (CAAX protease family)
MILGNQFMQIAILAVLLVLIFSLFSQRVQSRMRQMLRRNAALVWTVPVVLCGLFCAVAVYFGAFSASLAGLLIAYTLAPTLFVYIQGPNKGGQPSWLDLVAILLLWLPLELAVGHQFIPKHIQGFLHSVAYGIAILLALVLFLGFRSLDGMKYNLPSTARDYWLPLAAFAVTAPILAGLGVILGFISPFHWPVNPSFDKLTGAFGVIFAGTALPEEILFRSLIQNLLMARLGPKTATLMLASFIFGCAHLNNGPQALPNWRYMILATIAGFAYGWVFQKSSTVLSSAALHALVDWTKHYFF